MDTFLNNLVRRRYPTSDTAAKLATLTGVPTADDWFHETDTGRFKFADGQRTYTELPYAPVGLTTSVVLEAYGTSVTPGQPIALRVEGVGEVISENSGNVSRWIGIAETGASVNEKFTCTVFGGINRDMSGLVPGSYYYFENDGTLTTTTTPYFVGRAILSTELLILNTGRGSILSNNPPDQPINISPVSGATNVTQTPTLVSSGFSSSGDTHAKSRWQVSTVSNFASILYDSGAVDDLTSHTLTTSSVNLQNGTIYYWRVKHEGTSTGWSDWSLATPLQVSVVSGVQWWIVPGVYTWQCPEGVFEVDIAIAPDTEPTSFSNLLVGSAVAVQGWTNGVNLPEARADGAAVSDSDGNIYYFGGVDSSDAASQKAFKFNVSTNQWSNLADVPGGLAQDVVAVSVGNLIYIYSTSTNAVGNFMVYNTALNTYTNLNALAVNNVHYTTINAANGFVYVFGGTTGTDHRDEIQKYNIATGSWSVLSSRLPQGVYGLKTGKDAQGNIKLWGGQGSSGNPLNLLTFYIDTETVVNTGPNLPAPTDERQPGCSDSQGNLYSFGIHNSPSPAPYGVFYKLAAGASSWQPFETPSQIQGSGAVAVCTPSNNIHIIAGRVAGASGQSDLIQKINLNGNSWTQNTSLPGPRDQFGIAIDDNDNIYVFGGQDANMYLANGYKYTKLTQQWTPIANMSVTRANITGVRVGNKIFTFGGTSTNVNVLNSAESYNITTDTWANIQPIPGNATLQAYGAVALSDDKVYITGGNNSAGADNVSYKYDPTTNVFSNISGMAYAIVEHGMVVDADDAVWVVGGNANEGSGFSSFLYKYDIGNVGVPNPGYKAPLPQPVVDAAVCIDKTKGVIYVIGGYNNTGHLSTVYEYTIATNVWRTLPPIPLKLRSAGAVVDSSGVIWLVGGNDESTGRKATVYTYDPVGFDFDGETEILTGNGFNFTGPSIVSTPGLSGVNSKVAAIGRAKAVVPLTNYTVSVGGPSGAARVEWGPQVSQAGEQIYTTSGTFNFVVPQGVTSMSALAIPNLDSVSVGTLLSTTKLSSSSSSTSNTYTTSQSVTVPVGITNVTMIGNNTGPIIPSLTIDSATNLYRRTHIGVESSNRIYLLGGRNYNGSSIDSSPGTRIVQRFNISTNQVERLQDLPEALDYFTAVADQTTGNIYVFGGVNLTSANNSLKSYKFDVNTSQWTTLADLPFSLIYASGVYFNSPQTGGDT